jgi:hypothetical protein
MTGYQLGQRLGEATIFNGIVVQLIASRAIPAYRFHQSIDLTTRLPSP